MRLKMMAGGDTVDYDVLTATAADVPEGLKFLGTGSEDEQTGTLPNRVNMHGSPGYSVNDPDIPIHPAEMVSVTKNTNNATQIVLAPPKGKYPGGTAVYVGCAPADVGIDASKIANKQAIAGVEGIYGSDANLVPADLRAGKVAYGSSGRVAGGAVDHGKISRTIGAGESYDIKEGFYGAGKVTAKDLASQTPGTAASEYLVKNKTAIVNGKTITGAMVDCGEAQNARNNECGVSGDYFYTHIPSGWYHSNGSSGAPEARAAMSLVRDRLGISAAKIVNGQSIGGVNGTAPLYQQVNQTIFDANLSYTNTSYSYSGDEQTYHVDGQHIWTDAYGGYILLIAGIAIDMDYTKNPIWYPIGTYSSRAFNIKPINNWKANVQLVISRNKQGQIWIKGCNAYNSGTYRTVIKILGYMSGMNVW